MLLYFYPGSPYTGSQCDFYELPVIDLVYTRKQYRRKGYATLVLEDLLDMFPKQDVGFSQPISPAMMKGNTLFCLINAPAFP